MRFIRVALKFTEDHFLRLLALKLEALNRDKLHLAEGNVDYSVWHD